MTNPDNKLLYIISAIIIPLFACLASYMIFFKAPKSDSISQVDVEILKERYNELPSPLKDQFIRIIYLEKKGDYDLKARIKVLFWLKNMSQGDSARLVKDYEKAIECYQGAYFIWEEQPAPLHKHSEVTIDDALDLEVNSHISTVQRAINLKSKNELEAALNEAQKKLEQVLSILSTIENAVGQKFYDTEGELSPEDLKGLTYYQLGRIYLIKEIIDRENSAEYLKLAYRCFNTSVDLNCEAARSALDYMQNSLKYTL